MRGCRIVLTKKDGNKVWINPMHVTKMEKTPDDRYFIFVTNGEVYQIDGKTARNLENSFESD